MDKVLNYIGLARKAGRAELGKMESYLIKEKELISRQLWMSVRL